MNRQQPKGRARRVLLAPNLVSRAAARAAGAREEAWMLSQPRKVRESYVREVLEPQLQAKG